MLGNIYEAKPRYEILNDLLYDELTNIRYSNVVNVIVDVKQLYRKIFRSSYELDNTDPRFLTLEAQRITSDIISIIGHYRNYLVKYSKYSNFYFLYSSKECDLIKEISKDYKSDYYEKYVTFDNDDDKLLLLSRCNQAMRTIINLFPNCKFIDTSKFDEYVVARHITEFSNKNVLNIILSNDENMFQLVSSNVICLNISGITTSKVTTSNIYEYFDIKTNLSSGLYSYALSMAGNKKYSINGISGIGMKKAVSFLESLVNAGIIQNTKYQTFDLKKEQITDELIKELKLNVNIVKHLDQIEKNFEIFTLNKLFNENLNEISLYFISSNRIYSLSDFKKINDMIFTNYPLDLNKILKGEL